MKKVFKIFLLVLSLFLVFGLSETKDASAQVFLPEIVEANGTEYNSTTPTINIIIIGDEDSYTGNISFNYTSAIFDADLEADVTINVPTINNDTSLAVAITTALPLRTTIFVNLSFWNETMDVMNSTSVEAGGIPVIFINGLPTLVISVEDKVPIKGQSITFTGAVTDGNSTGTGNDHTKIVICADSSGFSVAGGCSSGTEYCRSSAFVDAGTAQTCAYTIPMTLPGGAHKVYTYAFDDIYRASSSASEGVFTTAAGVNDEEEDEASGGSVGDIIKEKGVLGVAVDTKLAGIPLWVVIVFLAVIAIAVYWKYKKS